MPSLDHEMPLELVRTQPALATELLRTVFDLDIPEGAKLSLGSETLNDCDPTEYRCDATVLVGAPEKPDLGIIVEVQMQPSKRKTFSWPAYMTTLRARRECPVTLLVLCPDEKTADRCAEPIDLGHPGLILKPLALSIADMPPVTDHAKARALPELAVLSALAHADGPDSRAVLEAYCVGMKATPPDIGRKYDDYVTSHLSKAARRILEELMALETYEFKSEFAREHIRQGRAEGKIEGEIDAVLRVLSARGLVPTEEQRGRIISCDDLDLLRRWVERAVTAEKVEQIFD